MVSEPLDGEGAAVAFGTAQSGTLDAIAVPAITPTTRMKSRRSNSTSSRAAQSGQTRSVRWFSAIASLLVAEMDKTPHEAGAGLTYRQPTRGLTAWLADSRASNPRHDYNGIGT